MTTDRMAATTREERLAKALRDNLRRRKAQAREAPTDIPKADVRDTDPGASG